MVNKPKPPKQNPYEYPGAYTTSAHPVSTTRDGIPRTSLSVYATVILALSLIMYACMLHTLNVKNKMAT